MGNEFFSNYISKHKSFLSYFSLICFFLFFGIGLFSVLPYSNNFFINILIYIKGQGLRNPDKWIRLFKETGLFFLFVSAFFILLFIHFSSNEKLRTLSLKFTLLDDYDYSKENIDNVDLINKKVINKQNVIMFIILFVLFILHAPEDVFTPYLWAEDGSVLIQGAIYDGLKTIFRIDNVGGLWIGQKILSLLCYWLVKPFNTIALLPYIQQILAKLLVTLSVFYFISEDFKWLVKERWFRFIICIALVVFVPQNSVDVVTCETSLPVFFIFTLFLVGLDCLFNPLKLAISWKQTLFLVLFSISWPAAPLALFVAGVAFLRYYIFFLKNKETQKDNLSIEIIKLCIVSVAVIMQVFVILKIGRASSELNLLKRLFFNTACFIFLPFLNSYVTPSLKLFVIGFLCWIAFWKLGKIPLSVILFSAIFSWGLLLLSGMSRPVNLFYNIYLPPRYYFTSFEISLFLIMVASRSIIGNKNTLMRCVVIFVFLAIEISGPYWLEVEGAEFAKVYKRNCFIFDRNGKDIAIIPVGPHEGWNLKIPASIAGPFEDDIDCYIDEINGHTLDLENYEKPDISFIRSEQNNIKGKVKLKYHNDSLTSLFIKNPVDNSFLAAYELSCGGEYCTYSFNLESSYFSSDDIGVEVYGRTKDGTWHKGIMRKPIVIE